METDKQDYTEIFSALLKEQVVLLVNDLLNSLTDLTFSERTTILIMRKMLEDLPEKKLVTQLSPFLSNVNIELQNSDELIENIIKCSVENNISKETVSELTKNINEKISDKNRKIIYEYAIYMKKIYDRYIKVYTRNEK
uniref:Uncharacterized protein n=1 Tax=viral metagenome TaxID=1070528 RepID=A0A6C0JQA3_9ZZZZ